MKVFPQDQIHLLVRSQFFAKAGFLISVLFFEAKCLPQGHRRRLRCVHAVQSTVLKVHRSSRKYLPIGSLSLFRSGHRSSCAGETRRVHQSVLCQGIDMQGFYM
jgi:hypothetical protein